MNKWFWASNEKLRKVKITVNKRSLGQIQIQTYLINNQTLFWYWFISLTDSFFFKWFSTTIYYLKRIDKKDSFVEIKDCTKH